MKSIDSIIDYFGQSIVERSIANYFSVHGTTEDVRDYLMCLEAEKPDMFLEMVCDFIDKGST